MALVITVDLQKFSVSHPYAARVRVFDLLVIDFNCLCNAEQFSLACTELQAVVTNQPKTNLSLNVEHVQEDHQMSMVTYTLWCHSTF